MQGTSFVVAPIACHAFFEKAEFKRLLCDDLFEIFCLPTQFFDLICGRSPRCVTSEPLLPLLSASRTDGDPSAVHEVLRPSVIQALSNPLTAAQL